MFFMVLPPSSYGSGSGLLAISDRSERLGRLVMLVRDSLGLLLQTSVPRKGGCLNGIHNCQARKRQVDRGFHVFWELTRIIRLRGGRNTSIRWETNDFLSDQHFAL
jgi:hypothetical protein